MAGVTGVRGAGVVRWVVLAAAAVLLVLLGVGSAVADPSPSPPPATPTAGESPAVPADGDKKEDERKPECDLLTGPAKQICIDGAKGGGPSGADVLNAVAHPIDALAEACADMGIWFTDEVSKKINTNTRVDLTNPGFLERYAVAFAASTFLTLILWLIAVAKRAVRGVPVGTAMGEAIGLLWLLVSVSAFLPLGLYLTVSAVDGITSAIGSSTQADTEKFMAKISAGLNSKTGIGGGPMTLILVSLLTGLAGLVLWVELLVREAMIYTGAILAPVVFSGIVDRALWSHVRRWAGTMVAVLLAKPILVIVLGLGLAVGSESDGAVEGLLSAISIMGLAVWCGLTIYKWVPSVGDEMTSLHYAKKAATAPAGVPGSGNPRGGVVGMMRQAMAADTSRGNGVRSQHDTTTESTPIHAVSAGVAADTSRGNKAASNDAPAPGKKGK
jgi:hypothetical protein